MWSGCLLVGGCGLLCLVVSCCLLSVVCYLLSVLVLVLALALALVLVVLVVLVVVVVVVVVTPLGDSRHCFDVRPPCPARAVQRAGRRADREVLPRGGAHRNAYLFPHPPTHRFHHLSTLEEVHRNAFPPTPVPPPLNLRAFLLNHGRFSAPHRSSARTRSRSSPGPTRSAACKMSRKAFFFLSASVSLSSPNQQRVVAGGRSPTRSSSSRSASCSRRQCR